MAPLFAAVASSDTATSLVHRVTSLWNHQTASASNKSKTPGSFASLLQSSGADVGNALQGVVSGFTSATSAKASANRSGGSVDTIA